MQNVAECRRRYARGRPFLVLLDVGERAKLDLLAVASGVSRSDVIRHLLRAAAVPP